MTEDIITIPSVPISLAMIVKDEERTLERCLRSVQNIATEIIIVDTGSTDTTKAIANKFTDKIYDFTWVDDFAAARNYAFSLATQEYVMWLDADDVILESDQKDLLSLLQDLPPDTDAISMYYNLVIGADGKAVSRLRRNRIVKKSNQFQWIGAVHEYLAVGGKVVMTDAAVTHCPLEHDAFRNLHIYEERLKKGEIFSPRDLYYFANELLDHQLYNRAVEYYERFLATKEGWVEDNIGACGKIADCFYYLKETENQLKYIYKSFDYDTPRAEACCRLGFHHWEHNQLQQAIFWYDLATKLKKPDSSWGLINIDCWTWIPHIQLCVCYSQLQNYTLAHEHNEKAAEYIPNSPKIEHNRKFLQNFLKNE